MKYQILYKRLNFTKLWVAQILSQVGQNIINFALIIHIYELALGSRLANSSVALLMLCFGLPAIIFASTAGIFADQFNRRMILIITNLSRALLVLVYLSVHDSIAGILLLTFLVSIATQFFIPAEAATIPKLVKAPELLTANSFFTFTFFASFIVGYAAAGPIITLFGDYSPYFVGSALFLVSAILVYLIPNQPTVRTEQIAAAKLHIFRELRRNWRNVRRNKTVGFAVDQLTTAQAIIASVLTLAPALSVGLIGTPLKQASHIFIIPVGIGMVLGVASVNVVTRYLSKVATVFAGLFLGAAALVTLGLSKFLDSPAVIVACSIFVLGVVNALINATSQTLLQESTDDASRGKAYGVLNMTINLAGTLPIFLVGILADIYNPATVITFVGVFLFLYGVMYFLQRGQIKSE